MSNVLYGGKILISENGSPKMDKKIKGDHHPETENLLEDQEEKAEISAEYAEEHQEDDEDGDDDEEATEEEEFLCPVCQGGEEELDSFAKLAECEHVFCEPCITEWSKNADTCPICRNRFDHLCTCDTLRGDYSTKVKIQYKSKDSVTVEVEHYVCQICHSGQNEELLLLCDGCDEAYHTHCLRPQLDNIPDGDWFCVQCSGGGEEDEEGLDINPGSGSIQFRLPSTTRRLAMEELLRRTRRTSDRRTSRAERRRSSSISQAVQLISSITGRARTAKGAKLARIATRTVGIHTLRGLRNKRNKRSKRRAANSAAWSPPRKSSPERLEAWNQRDTRPSDLTSSEVAGFSTAAIRAHKAPKAESVLGAHRYFEEAQPGPSTQRDSAVNPTPVNVLDLITADIINATSKTATVDKKGDIVYKTRDEVLKEKDTKNAPKQSVDQECPVRQRKVRIDSSKCSPSKSEEKKSSKRKRDSTSEKRPKVEEKLDKSSEKRDKSSEKSKSGGGKRKSSKKESRSRSRSYSSSPRRRRSSKSVKSPPKTKKEANDSIVSENSSEVPAVKDSAGKEDVVKASDSQERKEISENEKKSAKLPKTECSDKETSSSKKKSSSDDKRKTGSFSDNKDDGKEETSSTAPEGTKNVRKSKHAKSFESTHVKTDKRSDEKSDKASSNKSKSSRNNKLGKENENENTSVEKEAKKRKKEKGPKEEKETKIER
ncbi:remodeling and spacing factor 1-like [Bolinopsis microptera]|uniref:remodeling and spacing factor 1-like n=1 Tax=Bolinopsis microptera TaxID=2820187 RepID=UPI00307AC48F